LVKLPGAVEPLFLDWLRRTIPDRAGKIINRIKDTRKGKMTDSRFGTRMTGEGGIAQTINSLFDINARKHNVRQRWEELSTEHFCRSTPSQFEMF
ncbi:MAG TPA: radical SAM protein, partial [Bacteroidetes bacterium]|nr:radical SAM protein [Bacteroidota bacterium]